MSERLLIKLTLPVVTVTAIVMLGPVRPGGPAAVSAAQPQTSFATCDLEVYEKSEAEFKRLSALQRFNPDVVSHEALQAASLEFVLRGEACYKALYGVDAERTIDDGGLWYSADGSQPYVLFGTKWGSGSPYSPTGGNVPGPRIAGGTVTYSFMANGVDMTPESAGAGANVAITSLPNAGCGFTTEIADALAAWSAVANIQFVQTGDNGVAFNAPGAIGDIRIGAHFLGGSGGTLAHGYYPPPNGTSAAGDIHFDSADTWSCRVSGGIDIGIVAAHEIGHAIGLGHEPQPPTGVTALMNPFYNAAVPGPIADDISGAQNIYGNATTGVNEDLVIDFAAAGGLWRLDYGVGWNGLHPFATEGLAVGNMDGNGIDDVLVDFGPTYGLWAYLNNSTWVQVHAFSPTVMALADLDGNGIDDVVAHFAGYGVFGRYNNATWALIHNLAPDIIAVGNIDNVGGEDLVFNFPGQGVWSFRNNTTWGLIHGFNASSIAIGDLDAATGADDIAIAFPGYGLWLYSNNATWTQLHVATPTRLAVGDLDLANGRDDLAVDFGPGKGLYTLVNGATWTNINGTPTEQVLFADLNGNGIEDIVVDFGAAAGLWFWMDNGAWVRGHALSPNTMVAVDYTP